MPVSEQKPRIQSRRDYQWNPRWNQVKYHTNQAISTQDLYKVSGPQLFDLICRKMWSHSETGLLQCLKQALRGVSPFCAGADKLLELSLGTSRVLNTEIQAPVTAIGQDIFRLLWLQQASCVVKRGQIATVSSKLCCLVGGMPSTISEFRLFENRPLDEVWDGKKNDNDSNMMTLIRWTLLCRVRPKTEHELLSE